MKSLTTALSLTLLLGVAACASNPSSVPPSDTGSMGFPRPQSVGNVGTSQPASLDTGSMNTPRSTGGIASRPNPGFDTGNMALPNRAQGNSAPRSY
ncbi:MAG: hypothetical protein RQ966_01140 [Acetobacteraceae bacterium]|nr:hypothetical protein [Acetobacteraceae bacterium]